MTRTNALLITAILLVAAAPVRSHSAQQQDVANDTGMLAQSGIIFPEKLGSFVRTTISSAGSGLIGAHYELVQGAGPGSPTVDIFVRRVEAPLQVEFDATEQLIGRIYQDLSRVRDLVPPAMAPNAVGRLWKGSLSGKPVLTGMVISHRDGWRIKIRGTVSAERGETGWDQIETLIRAFDWGSRGG